MDIYMRAALIIKDDFGRDLVTSMDGERKRFVNPEMQNWKTCQSTLR